MTNLKLSRVLLISGVALSLPASPASAHKLHKSGEPTAVAASGLVVVPSRDWNRINGNVGKNTEVWTLDGVPLNDVTFYGGIQTGKPLVKERSKKRDPLPKFTKNTLLIEIPELLEGTYRTYKQIGSFSLLSMDVTRFLEHEGVSFEYEYVDADLLPRKGEARASIIGGRLYMMTYDAPRLHYYERNRADFSQIAASAKLK